MAKKINKYHNSTLEELNGLLLEKKSILFNMRFQKSLQQLEDPLLIRDLKKDIARIKTKISSINNERKNNG